VATATKAWDYLKIVLREWLKQLSILMKIKSDQLTEFHQKIVATWTSCMAFMLQGQLQLVTIGHVITALKVSVASGLVYLLLAPLLRIYKSWEQASGAVRGLLCGNCNKGLGLFKDSPERMVKAAKYINENQSRWI
jgi:hypothetical protein